MKKGALALKIIKQNNITREELEDFEKAGVINPDNTINYQKYKEWFHDFIDKADYTKNYENIMKRIDKANKISKAMCLLYDVKEEEIPSMGMMTEEQMVRFVIKRVDENELLRTTNGLIKNISEAASTKKAQKHEPETSEEMKTELKAVIYPVLQTAEKFKGEDKLKEYTEEFQKTLRLEKVKEEDIQYLTSLEKPLEKKDSDSDSLDEEDKKKKRLYNPLNDWLYIYYMWMLGESVRGFVFNFDVYDNWLNTLSKQMKSVFDFDYDTYDMPYQDAVVDFNDKYECEFNPDYFRGRVADINNHAEMDELYKNYYDYMDLHDDPNAAIDYKNLVDAIMKSELDGRSSMGGGRNIHIDLGDRISDAAFDNDFAQMFKNDVRELTNLEVQMQNARK